MSAHSSCKQSPNDPLIGHHLWNEIIDLDVSVEYAQIPH